MEKDLIREYNILSCFCFAQITCNGHQYDKHFFIKLLFNKIIFDSKFELFHKFWKFLGNKILGQITILIK